ncbi:hypothetical protein [Formosa maritima]|uniref:Uncharacterized protein n=1 Tax=Formosa maritima TaxID=2592046 RepID=A0A5D0GIZ5_9FLAO|nr:hypothetical protein [Formosa maritima]TYA58995.1 hypothetical protein FVF61_02265 [Formosa maritima]
MSKAVEITVSLTDSRTNPPKLTLKDSEGNSSKGDDITSSVDPGVTVTWIPDYSSGISELTGITKNTKITKDNYTLLDGNPVPKDGNYVGTIVTKSPGKGKKEYYCIGFKIDGDDTPYSDDPKLQMRN